MAELWGAETRKAVENFPVSGERIPLPVVHYRAALRAERPDLKRVVLEGVEVEGRTAIIYSPYSIDCGLDGHKCFACRGLVPQDAVKLASNIVLYALSY